MMKVSIAHLWAANHLETDVQSWMIRQFIEIWVHPSPNQVLLWQNPVEKTKRVVTTNRLSHHEPKQRGTSRWSIKSQGQQTYQSNWSHWEHAQKWNCKRHAGNLIQICSTDCDGRGYQYRFGAPVNVSGDGMMVSSSKLMGLIATIVGNYHIHDTTNNLLKSKSIERIYFPPCRFCFFWMKNAIKNLLRRLSDVLRNNLLIQCFHRSSPEAISRDRIPWFRNTSSNRYHLHHLPRTGRYFLSNVVLEDGR